MMLHSVMHWPEQANPQLWPFAMQHAVFLWNHMPRRNNLLAPVEVFSGTKMDNYHHLQRAHVWGAPTYVLDPMLQDGKKVPKWAPRTRQGMYMGVSPSHSLHVSLILSLRTGHVSPQYHLVHDDLFSTVSSHSVTSFDEKLWLSIVKSGYEALGDESDVHDVGRLSEEWLTDDERLARQSSPHLQRESGTHQPIIIIDAPSLILPQPQSTKTTPVTPHKANPSPAATSPAPSPSLPADSESPPSPAPTQAGNVDNVTDTVPTPPPRPVAPPYSPPQLRPRQSL
jgi:hypothetical protein